MKNAARILIPAAAASAAAAAALACGLDLLTVVNLGLAHIEHIVAAATLPQA